jgi:hypothetical protein
VDTAAILHRFPLVPRPRPPCSPLTTRTRRISDLAATAARDQDLAAASAAFNQAALLASDCGLPDLARQWCRRHTWTYLRYCPLDAQSARYALEPLVNLARLHIRDGNGDTAYTLLDTLCKAIRDRTGIAIDGIPVLVPELTRTTDDLAEVRKWLWTVHLADSPRALISAGRWNDAFSHLARHHGIGQRMLDGRQVAVIASYLAGDTAGAHAILAGTVTAEPWEDLVRQCLSALCAPGQPPTAAQRTAALDACRHLGDEPELALFVTRLGLTIIDTAGGSSETHVSVTARELIARVISWQDGYAARDLLAHEEIRAFFTADEETELARITSLCALGANCLPAHVQDQLTAALNIAETIIGNCCEHSRLDQYRRATHTTVP